MSKASTLTKMVELSVGVFLNSNARIVASTRDAAAASMLFGEEYREEERAVRDDAACSSWAELRG